MMGHFLDHNSVLIYHFCNENARNMYSSEVVFQAK